MFAAASLTDVFTDLGQRLEAANLVARESETPWESMLLAVDVKGATIISD